MSVEVREVADDKIVEVKLSGKLTTEDYSHFLPVVEAAIQENGKVRMLVIMHDFHGWTAGALWEDVKFDWRHFRDIERLALVGEKRWESGMAVFCKPFTTATVKYFDHTRLEEARQWITADLHVTVDGGQGA
jgi:hypothetical protein